MKKDGGPAFPGTAVGAGMSLRDWFAGQALATLARMYDDSEATDRKAIAERCYEVADAMLAEREKP